MTVRRSNEERSRSTRTQLLETARGLFAEQGYTATSMAGVAAAAQLSTGALYHHWPTKQDLFAAVVSTIHHRLATEIAATVPAEAPALQRFEQAGLVFLRRCTDRDVARILLTEGPSILGAAWDDLDQRWWLGPTEELLRQAMAEGSLVTADPHLLATALLGSLTALGRAITTHPDIQGAAEGVLLTLTQALRPQLDP